MVAGRREGLHGDLRMKMKFEKWKWVSLPSCHLLLWAQLRRWSISAIHSLLPLSGLGCRCSKSSLLVPLPALIHVASCGTVTHHTASAILCHQKVFHKVSCRHGSSWMLLYLSTVYDYFSIISFIFCSLQLFTSKHGIVSTAPSSSELSNNDELKLRPSTGCLDQI